MRQIQVFADEGPVLRAILAACDAAGATTQGIAPPRLVGGLTISRRASAAIIDSGPDLAAAMAIAGMLRRSAEMRTMPIAVIARKADAPSVLLLGKLRVRPILIADNQLVLRLKPFFDSIADVVAAPPAAQLVPSATTPAPVRSAPPAPSIPLPPPSQPSKRAAPTATTKPLNSHQPLINKSDLMAKIQAAADLPALGPVVHEVLSLANNPNSSMDDLAHAAKKDQSIALRLLKVANSAVFAHGQRVDTVQKAVQRIGTQATRDSVLSMAVFEQLGPSADLAGLRPDWLWEHAIAAALAARSLATSLRLDRDSIESVFTGGLLHDIGRLILAKAVPDLCVRVRDAAISTGEPWHIVERRLLHLDHAQIADIILRRWRLPTAVVEAVAGHECETAELAAKPPAVAKLAMILSLADRMADSMFLGSSGDSRIAETSHLFDKLGIPPDAAHDVWSTLPEQTAELRLAMLLHAQSAAGKTFSEELLATSPALPTLTYAGPTPHFAGLSTLCQLISKSSKGNGKPIVLGHLASGANDATMLHEVDDAIRESQPGALLLFVGTPNQDQARKRIGDRMSNYLRLPCPTPDFFSRIIALQNAPDARKAA